MITNKELIRIGMDWLNENASPDIGLCDDRSCIRCRLSDVLSDIEQIKCCDNCGSNDGYDCRTCSRSDNPDEGKPLQDHWVLDKLQHK